jgi:dipeptidyl aminopeptidase/acylaminoacyl peptidase
MSMRSARHAAWLIGLSMIALGAATAQAAQPAAKASAAAAKRYSAKQFYDTTSFSLGSQLGHVWSPDGKSLLISSDQSGVFNAYALPVAGGAPQPLTSSTDNATYGATFFPADSRMLFTADQGGNELNHVYVRERDGSVRDLTPGAKTKASFQGWSADGRNFWIASNERDPQTFDLYAYATDGYARRMVFQNSGFDLGAVSRDGRYLALAKQRTSADTNLYLVDLAAGSAPKLITEHQGDIDYGVAEFTPDGKTLVYRTNENDEFMQAWTYDLASGAKRPLIKADWDVAAVNHSPSGRYRVSALNADASTKLTIQDSAGKAVALKGLPAGDITGVRFNRDETMIALTVNGSTSPTDIYVADLGSGRTRRLTRALNPAIDQAQLAESQVMRFKSYDGVAVPGILYKPKNASASNPAPAIVLVHGGPGGQARRTYNAQVQHLVNHGYAVFDINNRGSSGYGKTFYHMDDKRHGDADLKDVVASKAFLQSMPWIAKDKIAIMGGSYGGYMVAAALAFQPDVFDAGINIFGVTNWTRTLQSIPPWWGAMKDSLYDEMGDPATDAERHRAISPLFHAKNIKKPLLVVQGANDPRVLKIESDELVAAVKANGTPVEYVVFPDEGHGFQRKANRITASEAYLKFLDRHLR